jgi:retinol dehydrogenase 12
MKTIVLVGATSGLGRQAAAQLAAAGHRLVLVGRDEQRAKGLAATVPSATVITADVATQAGVDYVAGQVASAVDHVDVLVNNAGVMTPARQTTAEGVELNFAVHHLAPYSMTSRLLPLLHGGEGRVINVNSEGHRTPMRGAGPIRLNLADLNAGEDFDPFLTYGRTKLANLLFSYELQRRHPELTVVALHPGMVRTDLGRRFPRVQVALLTAFLLSARQGARPLVRLATGADVVAGGYYNRFTLTSSSAASYDTATARRLWEATVAMRGTF